MPFVVSLLGNIDPCAIKWMTRVFTAAKLFGLTPKQRVRNAVQSIAIITWKSNNNICSDALAAHQARLRSPLQLLNYNFVGL